MVKLSTLSIHGSPAPAPPSVPPMTQSLCIDSRSLCGASNLRNVPSLPTTLMLR